MRRKLRPGLAALLAAALLLSLLLCSCAKPLTNEELGWEENWDRVGELIGVEPVEGFTLSENLDAMAVTGLYYATWTSGEGVAHTNEDDEESLVYDAVIYLVLKHTESNGALESEMEDLQEREQENYETGETSSSTYAGQDFTVMPLLQSNEGNPYSHGAAAFASRGTWLLCVECLCGDSFEGDPQTVLADFLDGLHYNDGGAEAAAE